MEVILNNPDVVRDLLYNVGVFASICKKDPKTGKQQEIPRSKAERIGLSCINAGHTSPTRWIYFNFTIINISRVCSHQVVRHSQGVAINQQSGVFGETVISKDTFVKPKSYSDLPKEVLDKIDSHIDASAELYTELRSYGISKSDSRYIIAQGVPTSINIGMDLEALINFCERRLCSKAQPEIRELATLMVKEVAKVEPRLKHLFKPYCLTHGGCKEEHPCNLAKKKYSNE